MTPDPFAALVALLARLEDELPYVTIEELCAHWQPPEDAAACRALVEACIADRRLFTDRRERLDPETGAVVPVRLVRLNRRHPAVAALLRE
ncbi:MAG TPA: hypothetical protein VFB73_14335 [Chloroflexota bacterium]|jgi:hypothetical protein|nr:hypothetical protein [Chloroflexota bacterium]HZU07141.1 hypothetical protein [Chloroflexota bacterium]